MAEDAADRVESNDSTFNENHISLNMGLRIYCFQVLRKLVFGRKSILSLMPDS